MTSISRERDRLHRFVFEHYPIRGHLVHLDAAWAALIEHREYPQEVQNLLGEAAAAALLLAATVKFEGVLSLQLQGDGPLSLLLAQCTSNLGVRGLARYREEAIGPALAAAAGGGEAPSLGELAGEGRLTVTLETDDGAQRYQGIVPLGPKRLADALQVYFENSEQLPTRLWLYADGASACGLLLQRLPAGAGVSGAAAEDVEDAWRRMQLIGDTLRGEELRDLAAQQLLHRLFNEDDVRLFDPAPVFFKCRCSRERVSGMLQGLGAEEIRGVLAERGEVEVRCDFCNRAYVFDAVDVEQLFSASAPSDGGGRVH